MLSHRKSQNIDIAIVSVSTKYVRYWSYAFTATAYGTHAKKIYLLVQKCYRVKERKKTKTKTCTIAKLFVLHTNEKSTANL